MMPYISSYFSQSSILAALAYCPLSTPFTILIFQPISLFENPTPVYLLKYGLHPSSNSSQTPSLFFSSQIAITLSFQISISPHPTHPSPQISTFLFSEIYAPLTSSQISTSFAFHITTLLSNVRSFLLHITYI